MSFSFLSWYLLSARLSTCACCSHFSQSITRTRGEESQTLAVNGSTHGCAARAACGAGCPLASRMQGGGRVGGLWTAGSTLSGWCYASAHLRPEVRPISCDSGLPGSTPLLQSAHHAHQLATTGIAMPTILEVASATRLAFYCLVGGRPAG